MATAFKDEIIQIQNDQQEIGLHPYRVRLVYINVKKKDGSYINVLETHDSYEPYLSKRKYSGDIIGMLQIIELTTNFNFYRIN